VKWTEYIAAALYRSRLFGGKYRKTPLSLPHVVSAQYLLSSHMGVTMAARPHFIIIDWLELQKVKSNFMLLYVLANHTLRPSWLIEAHNHLFKGSTRMATSTSVASVGKHNMPLWL
jgi:hypothetical protein